MEIQNKRKNICVELKALLYYGQLGAPGMATFPFELLTKNQ